MLPVIEKFMAARQLPDVTVVADAGMIPEANQKSIEAAGPVVHPRHEDLRRPLSGRQVAQGAPGRGDPRRARVHPALAGRAAAPAASSPSSPPAAARRTRSPAGADPMLAA